MKDEADEVLVSRMSLEMIESVLRQAYGYHAASDLQKQYQSGGGIKYSGLTRALQATLEIVVSHLAEGREGEADE